MWQITHSTAIFNRTKKTSHAIFRSQCSDKLIQCLLQVPTEETTTKKRKVVMWPRHVTPQSRYLSGAENCGPCCVIVTQCPQNLAFPSSARSSTLWSLSVSTATRKLFYWIFLDGNQGIIFQCDATFGFALARSWCWRVVSSYRNKVSRTRNAMFDNSVAHQCEDNVISRTNVNLFDIFNGAVVSRWWKWMVGRTSDTFSDSALWCQGSAGFIKSSPTNDIILLDVVRCCRCK